MRDETYCEMVSDNRDKWESYAKGLQAELAALKKQVVEAEQSARNWKFDCDQNVKWGLSMRDRAEAAEAKLSALAKDVRRVVEMMAEDGLLKGWRTDTETVETINRILEATKE